ncbi:MAG: cell division protein [Thermoleophilia bacterium]|nr:cell division protein [Thermoleophilia bacterium]
MRSRLNFYTSEAFRSLSTNKATSIAAVIAMLVALLIVGITAVGFLKARSTGDRIQRDASVVKVFLEATVTENQVNALTAELDGNSNVAKVEYVTKDAALERAKKIFKESPDVIDNLPANPFPASLEATLVDANTMDAVAKTVKGQPGVDEVKTGNQEARKVISTIQVGTGILFAVGVGILIAATVLVANTIRLSIYSRRREIEVMKLVGASNSFVRMPFMIEGLLCGVFASLLAMATVFGLVTLIGNVIDDFVNDGNLGTGGSDVSMPLIALGLLVLGIALGMFGSATSMRKYLRT